MVSHAIIALAAFAVGFAMTELTRRVVLRRDVLALPNERSSHEVPTPTAGGVAIVVPVAIACFVWLPGDVLRWSVAVATVAIALVGLIDDIVEVRRSVRFCVHLLASATCVFGLGIGGAGAMFVGLAFAWALNLYNFMDGIDGFAASQALAFSLGLLIVVPDPFAMPILIVLAATSGAFLLFNWSPARIFMGDVGSGFLGLTIAVIACALSLSGQTTLIVSLILLAAFWVDASYTLAVRVLTQQRFTEGHRSHFYQIVARRVGHGRTVAAFWLFWLVWLLPAAWLAHRWVEWQYAILAAAITPLLIGCAMAGAGRAHGSPVHSSTQ